jgi:hypothetical protein
MVVGSPTLEHQGLLPFADTGTSARETLVARWLSLTRTILPALAEQNSWPIHNDHCFMRVCLDAALGGPWHLSVKRPAIANLTNQQLAAAIKIAEDLVRAPETLEALNRQSIAWRNAAEKLP